jgi:uncharacterized protein
VKHYLIDGNNLIGKIKTIQALQQRDKQASRVKLAQILGRYFAMKKAKVTLHFDGFANDPINIPRLKIIYSENRSADDNIKDQIENSKNRKNLVVVTSDNNLREFAKVCLCDVIKSEEFVSRFLSSQDKNEEQERISSIDDAEEFKKLFGVK